MDRWGPKNQVELPLLSPQPVGDLQLQLLQFQLQQAALVVAVVVEQVRLVFGLVLLAVVVGHQQQQQLALDQLSPAN